MADTQTITSDQLCALTGLTDRRHRQLAKEGYFPPPKMSKYSFVPTLKGMFRYYREMNNDDAKKLTVDLRNAHLQHGLDLKRQVTLRKDHVALSVSRAFAAFRSRLISIPPNISARAALVKDQAEIEQLIASEIDKALGELSACPWLTTPTNTPKPKRSSAG